MTLLERLKLEGACGAATSILRLHPELEDLYQDLLQAEEAQIRDFLKKLPPRVKFHYLWWVWKILPWDRLAKVQVRVPIHDFQVLAPIKNFRFEKPSIYSFRVNRVRAERLVLEEGATFFSSYLAGLVQSKIHASVARPTLTSLRSCEIHTGAIYLSESRAMLSSFQGTKVHATQTNFSGCRFKTEEPVRAWRCRFERCRFEGPEPLLEDCHVQGL